MNLQAFKQDIQLVSEPVQGHESLLVLKFGSSVLKTLEDLPRIAGEIYRQRRKGHRIIAVVSALAGETDRLFEQARTLAKGTSCSGVAELVSLGEERTAALLAVACDKIGLKAGICRVEELGLYTSGNELDADFHELLPYSLKSKLDAKGVVIVPGFVGIGKYGERTLLGRGGSDFTAAILGGELSAKSVRLYKDVDGVYEADPAENPAARKYAQVGYEEALRRASKLVHAKAVAFAAQRNLPIEVEAIGSDAPTRIGGPSLFEGEKTASAPLRIALAGYGVVGQALASRLKDDPRFQIGTILVRDPARTREVAPPAPLTNQLEPFAEVKADVLVELLSCEPTGAALCATYLEDGIPVVTASKQVIAKHHGALAAVAERGKATLFNSATVGGGTPILEAVARARAAGPIAAVSAVLNGTVNFILERLHEGKDLAESLNEAKSRGFAEEDSSADLGGLDAAAKLKIIAQTAFGIEPEELYVETEALDEKLARTIGASGQRWVQLSEVRKGANCTRAFVKFVPLSTAMLVPVHEEWNCARIELENGRTVEVTGRGAGGPATAEAVLADLYDLAERRAAAAAAAKPSDSASAKGDEAPMTQPSPAAAAAS
jgi:homoserine dehydrogenase